MEEIKIFGHKNPDTDTIMSSLVLEELENQAGYNKVKAYRLGNVNKETEYALNFFKVEAPELLEEVKENDQVMLVDHNEFSQSVKGIEKAKILRVVDHHRIADFQTSEPLFYIAMPVGCTCTIIYDMYKMNNMEISKRAAGLMLSAILSDTLLLKSPTCTPKDVKVANELAEIAGVNINEYGLDMLKAGTDLSEFTPEELISIDSKPYTTNGVKYQAAQVNTVCIEDVLKQKQAIEKAIKEFMDANQVDSFIFMITDIIENNSQLIVIGRQDIAEKAFNTKFEENMAFLPGVVSRKKQIVPQIDSVL